jgi:hypothetical protein
LKVLSLISEIVSSADGSSSADAGKNLGQRFRALKAPLVKARPVALDDAPPSRKRPSPRIE